MKNSILLLIFLTASLFGNVNAQSKYGSDKEACGRNYTIYYEYYKLKNYDEAIPFWQKTIEICPQFSQNLWKNGEKMYRQKIADASNPKVKEQRIDSLLWILDKRIELYGTDLKAGEGYLLGKKGVILMTYRKESRSEAYSTLNKSLKIEQIKSKADVVLNYMKASVDSYSADELDGIRVLQDYELCMQIIDDNLLRKPGDKYFSLAQKRVETLFLKSGAADCNALITLFSKQFSTQQNDLKWLSKVEHQLKLSACTDEDFYLDIEIAMLKLKPEGSRAHSLGQFLMREESIDPAIKYLKLSLDYGVEDGEKAQVYYELAYLHYLHLKEYQKARDFAKEATILRPNWGDPYLLIGKIYIDARTAAFNDSFEQTTVLWAAIDQFAIAKNLDPKVTGKAKDLILTYSAYFPLKETLFLHTLKKGDDYKVEGWINEMTTVRSRD